jgi:methyl-accepting chemotaxis protein
VEAAGRKMTDIVGAVKQVSDVMSEIAGASTEQLAGIEQVSRSVTQMDQIVQQNAALVEQTAAATEALAVQAEQLVDVVARFQLDESSGTPPQGAQQAEEKEPFHGHARITQAFA